MAARMEFESICIQIDSLVATPSSPTSQKHPHSDLNRGFRIESPATSPLVYGGSSQAFTMTIWSISTVSRRRSIRTARSRSSVG